MRGALVLTLLLALAAEAGAARAVTVQVSGPRLRVSDLVPGELAADGDLGPAPPPGAHRRVSRREVVALLGAGGSAARRLPAYWQVETRAQALTCAELLRRTRLALADKLAAGLRVESIACARPLSLPQGTLELAARIADGARRAGRVPVELSLRVGEWPAQTLHASALIDGQVAVLVAVADLASGSSIGGADVRVERRLASTLPSDAVADAAELAGKKLTAALRAGTIVRRGGLAEVPLVARGAVVTVAVVLHGMRLTTRAIAREEAKRGETVTVQCLRSQKLIKARAVAANYVVVDL